MRTASGQEYPSGSQAVMALYNGVLVEEERILYPHSSEDARASQDELVDRLASIARRGGHIAIVDGAFDVPHDNHTWYLREARRLAAARHFGDTFTAVSPAAQRAMAASSELTLIVTLDADAKIAFRKGFQPTKGNVARPVYTWEARANRIGGLMIPNGYGAYQPILDLVTVEGDPRHQGTMFESHLDFGRTLVEQDLLGTWILFDEHKDTVATAHTHVGSRGDIISVVPQDQARFAVDPSTGQHWSSSSIIQRIVRSSAA
jgi:hypothetical protein